jgi:protein-S-isoprenylcysteine O-methyltransferase Ste14
MNKLSFFGIGPKIGIVAIPWLAASIWISETHYGHFTYFRTEQSLQVIAGTIILIASAVFYFLTLRVLLRGLKETKLITTGSFSLCRNPLYASFILFLIPSLSLLLNSWLVLTASLAAYIIFKISIRQEDAELEKFFGDDYLKYRNDTPEIFPFPFKKLFRKSEEQL